MKKLRREDEDDGEGTWETVKGGVVISSVSCDKKQSL